MDQKFAFLKNSGEAIIRDRPVAETTIALLHSYDLIDDFLDSINISLETFCQEFLGSWMFGYINALKQAGVRTVIFCISTQVTKPTRLLHQPTGTTICALPPFAGYHVYRSLRRKSLKLYGAKEGETFKDIVNRNISLRNSSLTFFKNLAQSFGSYCCTPLYLLARELKRENCQVILCQEYEYARFDVCVMLGKSIGIPVYGVFQGSDRTLSLIESPLRQWSLNNCAGVIIASQQERNRVKQKYQLPDGKIAPIFNPLDLPTKLVSATLKQTTRQELGIKPQAKVVMWHGRVEIERKGLDILLSAWKLVCQQRLTEQLCLLLVGTGSDATQLRQMIATLELTNIIWIDQFISDRSLIHRYLSVADIYTFPSRQEGFPLAPIEAMACQLPVVAANAVGVADILTEGTETGGIIVPLGNITALAAALGELLDDPVKRQHLAKLAHQRAKSNFSAQAISQQLREVLLSQRDPVVKRLRFL
ncbi:MAG TPA: glycosyltransferase family 4 protein [Xenococcaceae cyanobacterium]